MNTGTPNIYTLTAQLSLSPLDSQHSTLSTQLSALNSHRSTLTVRLSPFDCTQLSPLDSHRSTALDSHHSTLTLNSHRSTFTARLTARLSPLNLHSTPNFHSLPPQPTMLYIDWNGLYSAQPAQRAFAARRIRSFYWRYALVCRGIYIASCT